MSPRYNAIDHRRHTYGLDEVTFQALLVRQAGCCAICWRHDRRLVVDHDHRTGEVRGLLCDGCNRALGHMHDDPVRCLAAAVYLARNRPAMDAGRSCGAGGI